MIRSRGAHESPIENEPNGKSGSLNIRRGGDMLRNAQIQPTQNASAREGGGKGGGMEGGLTETEGINNFPTEVIGNEVERVSKNAPKFKGGQASLTARGIFPVKKR